MFRARGEGIARPFIYGTARVSSLRPYWTYTG